MLDELTSSTSSAPSDTTTDKPSRSGHTSPGQSYGTSTTTGSPGGTGSGESVLAFDEVIGDPTVTMPPVKPGIEVGALPKDFDEVGTDNAESAEEFLQATPTQLAAGGAESGIDGAFSDLSGIEGFDAPEPSAAGNHMLDAGAGMASGKQEFLAAALPIISALGPPLLSIAGPPLAQALMNKLTPRARRVVKRVAARPAVKIGVPVPPFIGALARNSAGVGGPGNVLSLIAKLLQSAQNKGGGESSGLEAVSQDFVTEAAAAMEVIIGADNRVAITNTTAEHWRRVCALSIQFPSGATYRGTGFFIGPRAVATAGHCVYLRNQGGWARKIQVIPGCNGSTRPFGQVEATTFRSFAGWVNQGLPECDVGCIFVPAGSFAGKNLGSFGFAAFDAPTLLAQQAVIAGYPGDKPFAELWGMADFIKAVSAKTLVYDADSVGGQSGCPVYVKRGGTRYVVGIHNYGASSGNSATRITPPVYERLLAWSKM